MLKILRAKLHDLHVTSSNLNYHGSITIDEFILREAGIFPLEFVYIWNKNNGQRISTYVIPGESGSGCCILNGSAARSCQVGDPVIITAFEYVDGPTDLFSRTPTILLFDANNKVIEKLNYKVRANDNKYLLQTSAME